MTAADLQDAPALSLIPTRLLRLVHRQYFAFSGRVPNRREVRVIEVDADVLVERDEDDGRGDAA